MTARTTPRARTADKRYYGVVEALVAENDGDDEGRVRLRFPWFDDVTVTDWVRVAQPYAGNGYGALFVPEKGDEVLVAFVHGDMRFPVVLGGLYNGRDKPPAARTEGRDRKTVRTRHGHEVLLDDTPSSPAVRITSAAGHTVELDDTGAQVRVTAAEGGSVTVTAHGDITLKAPRVTVDSAAIDLGGGATEPLVLGNALLQAFNAHTHPTPAGPSGPPAPPLTPAVLARKARTA
ncbi:MULTISPECIES: phage baseplate assembly protein V [Streptomyces]|uniref:Phage-related baseplate assembly protein n=2 Tax=Streptomyces TaxID=1883 RepID=A0A1D8GAH6_9ACTN|nr:MULTISPECIES: phage baseplate assembly protein V [Streptomyces]AOT62467.1 Phage-related baseplate assembly protein [Streptomyces rubrolavendulae]KAF0648726.1 type IV secretion protein Rhs [Streptomyces fradiae ATCC 10745 = DSM 40063]OSY54088.1 Phage-related baseplate assembly protein [Streptomyces fradiae ATCC 10745 = DSM 40063]QEV15258.1 type IV secretion protein Rhs [Streptomyces fradiae ATCC 10745 = DSM 40063]UQS30098.1 type IV secretion protein Rhs [Streptomyces fradiae]